METKGRTILIEELRKHKLCVWYWSEEVSAELEKAFILNYEPIGEMGIYSKYFEFHTEYIGKDKRLSGTEAVINLAITANSLEYDIEKAIRNIDCFHNVRIKVVREGETIISSRFRLWSNQEEEYIGDESALDMLLQNCES